MQPLTWTKTEKKIARTLFETAQAHELSDPLVEFKRKAAAAQAPDDLWAIQRYLAQRQRAIEDKYDYRYSQMIAVLARLLREGRIQQQLAGLSDEKRGWIQRFVEL